MQHSTLYPALDLKETIASNRLVGLWRFLGGFRWIYMSAIISLGIATVAKSLTYLLLQYFVDDILAPEQRTTPLYLFALGFVALAVFQGGFTFLSGKLAARSAEGAILRLRNYLFDHLQYLSFSYHDHAETGELVQRCSSDVDTIRRFFADQAIGIGRIVLLFLINFIALLVINVKLGLLSIISMPIIITMSILFFRKIHAAYELHQEQEGLLSTALQENLSGVRVVKAFARQDFEINKFEEANWEQYQRGRKLVKLHSLYWPISEIISGAQMIFIFFLGGLMVINQEITIGAYLAVMGLVIWIIWPMQNLGRLIVQTSMGLVSYNRIVEILNQDREQVDNDNHTAKDLLKSNQLKGALEFRNVSFAYDENLPVLHNLSFTVESGQTIALMGPTGSGKSSLINLLLRFYGHNGTILLDGIELKNYPKHDLRRQIGIVEQEPFLFSRSIGENIAYGVKRQVSQHEIEAAAQAAAVHEVIMTFPDGYNTIVGEKGVMLSGGQKQRVTIARTLLKDPSILIFDDAVSAVDTETEAHIHSALEQLRQSRTTFIIAHRIQTVMQADKILVLDQGHIVQQGSHAELMAQDGIYQKTYKLQAQIELDVSPNGHTPQTVNGPRRV